MTESDWDQQEKDRVPPTVDPTRPSIARIYDAILGGKDNLAVDRAVAELACKAFPDGGEGARLNRAVLARAVRHMCEQGVDQFLDLGSGLPTVENTHEIAQAVNPDAKVVYVDNDPVVLTHGRALLATNANTTVVTSDLRTPQQVLEHPQISGFLDMSKPIGLLLVAIVHHVLDEEDPAGLIAEYKKALAPGSYMLITHFTNSTPEARELETVLLRTIGRGQLRSREEITAFFDGFELVEPGVVHPPQWRPDDLQGPAPQKLSSLLYLAGLGRKPDA
ncbi:S-adenosyl methyltransferase [Sinosporangium album]|uniref:S-adenosyl methyltransferase n=1 Tax=Sinosporangium album TaxID=504805 RepID=A0A1G8JIQ7_9ACTN|nr:SAM-dependent methyltransferase [Sinosporangium album]SDI31154.1 S-adenosyl methyltransferase [Sinosporangium album]